MLRLHGKTDTAVQSASACHKKGIANAHINERSEDLCSPKP